MNKNRLIEIFILVFFVCTSACGLKFNHGLGVSGLLASLSPLSLLLQGANFNVGGSAPSNRFGIYGTLGVASSNNLPGPRNKASVAYNKTNGKVYLYGGEGYDAFGSWGGLNDLWNFDTLTGNWTWVSGSNTINAALSAGVNPGAREGATLWVDHTTGFVYLFGGYTYGAGFINYPSNLSGQQGPGSNTTTQYNDLWLWNGIIWSNLKSPGASLSMGVGAPHAFAAGNYPSARYWSQGVFYNSKLYLYAGFGNDDGTNGGTGILGDMWVWDIGLGQWAYDSGPVTYAGAQAAQGAWVGCAATPAVWPTCGPGGRENGGFWVNSAQNMLYVFGGLGKDSIGNPGSMDDMWSYDPATYKWGLLSPANTKTRSQTSVAGASGIYNAAYYPGGRSNFTYWQDTAGKFYIYAGLPAGGGGNYPSGELWVYDSTTTKWAYLNGTLGTTKTNGVFNSQGNFTASNQPGSFQFASGWSDLTGVGYVFGGQGYDSIGIYGYLNNVWKFDVSQGASGQWNWMSGASTNSAVINVGVQGVAAASNLLGPRKNTFSWVDGTGNFNLFGGLGYDGGNTIYGVAPGKEGFLGDHWIWDGANWTWFAGNSFRAANSGAAPVSPPSRAQTQLVSDGIGNYYFFGGAGIAVAGAYQGYANDTWQWDGSIWSRLIAAGTTAGDRVGVYPALGTPASATTKYPGGRTGAMSWYSTQKYPGGRMYIFGGLGCDFTGAANYCVTNQDMGYMNDMWEFDPAGGPPTYNWISGLKTNTFNGPQPLANYGFQSVYNSTNLPGARAAGATWKDSSGKLYMFGGYGLSISSTLGYLNDLWVYDLSKGALGQWSWISGGSGLNASGVYGVMGYADPANVPGARDEAAYWTDSSSGYFYLFGGYGYDSTGATGYLNDLWRWDGTSWTWIAGSNLVNQKPSFGTQGTPSFSNWLGGRAGATASRDSASGYVYLFGGQGLDSVGSISFLNDLWKIK